MKEQRTAKGSTSSYVWEHVEEFVQEHVQRFIQALLEEAVRELVGRQKSVRRAAVGAPAGYRNGHGKPWRLALMKGRQFTMGTAMNFMPATPRNRGS